MRWTHCCCADNKEHSTSQAAKHRQACWLTALAKSENTTRQNLRNTKTKSLSLDKADSAQTIIAEYIRLSMATSNAETAYEMCATRPRDAIAMPSFFEHKLRNAMQSKINRTGNGEIMQRHRELQRKCKDESEMQSQRHWYSCNIFGTTGVWLASNNHTDYSMLAQFACFLLIDEV